MLPAHLRSVVGLYSGEGRREIERLELQIARLIRPPPVPMRSTAAVMSDTRTYICPFGGTSAI